MTLTEALIALYEAGKIASPLRRGMRVDVSRRGETEDWDTICGECALDALRPHERIDTTDAATVGCLLSLLREATRERSHAVPRAHPVDWIVSIPIARAQRRTIFGKTEAGAIANALIALAQEVA